MMIRSEAKGEEEDADANLCRGGRSDERTRWSTMSRTQPFFVGPVMHPYMAPTSLWLTMFSRSSVLLAILSMLVVVFPTQVCGGSTLFMLLAIPILLSPLALCGLFVL